MGDGRRLVVLAGVLGAVVLLPLEAIAQPAPPTLTAEALVDAVVQGNRSVEALQHAVTAAEARERPAGALDDPTVAYAIAPRSLGVDDLDPGHILRVEQPLPWWGKRDTRRAAAAAATDHAQASLAAVQQQATLMARQLFADWFLVHAQLRINAQQQTLLADLEDTAEGLYASGLGSQSGVLSASLRREQRVQSAMALHARRLGIAARINAVRNQAASTPVAPPGPLDDGGDLPSLDHLSRAVLGANPTLRQLHAEQRQAARAVSLAELAYKPDVRLSA